MTTEYYTMGEQLQLDPARLQFEESRRLFAACQQHSAFDVVELRRIERGFGDTKDIIDGIVVECCDGTVPSRNVAGIKNRERLLLLHGPGLIGPHEVNALRRDFPATLHQNSVREGDPPSLCIHAEPWSAVERTWTPAKHLERILWWLRETALGKLHLADQPVERMHFVSPFQLVLPADFVGRAGRDAEVLHVEGANSRPDGKVLRGYWRPKGSAKSKADAGIDSLMVAVPTVISTGIERYPATLGALHDQLARKGSSLLPWLVDSVKRALPPAGGIEIPKEDTGHTLLLLQIPMARSPGAEPERTDTDCYFVHASLVRLGLACGAYFDGKDSRAYANNGLGSVVVPVDKDDAWRELKIEPIDARVALTPKDARQAAGVPDDGAEFQGILAGVGALGSCMAELWWREGWGNWTFIDDDVLLPHNLVRHAGEDRHIGRSKVDVVTNLAELTWSTTVKPKGIAAKVTDDTPEVRDAFASAALLVDATTTLEAPRDLAVKDDSPRMASVFLTPSGLGSVLLLEDADRDVRLTTLEAQYYRAILKADWGEQHLTGHFGAFWVGAGCRDVSGVLSPEVVHLHGSTLAKQVRQLAARKQAELRVWTLDDETGSLTANIIPVEEPIERTCGDWRVLWDKGVEQRLRAIRAECLPSETGGIILGYRDHRLKTIHIVDVLGAPGDSKANPASFIRGTVGLAEALDHAASRTANIVGYIGEWHSHPKYSSAAPSGADVELLAYLARTLAMDGIPALMVIVGESEVSVAVGEGRIV